MMPIRIQRKRTRGWKMPPNTVSVTRPGKFGNHYVVWKDDADQWTVSRGSCHWTPPENTKASAHALAVEMFRKDATTEGPHNHQGAYLVPTRADIIKELRGKDVACFCRLDEPCHGNVLIEVANGPWEVTT